MFSIIVPTYNRATLIKRTIRSLLTQTESAWELLVIDDGSTDNTESEVRSFDDPRIQYHQLESNQGVHAARNRGLDLAKGMYIVLLDSDDELDPTALKSAREAFEKFPDVGLVSAPFRTSDGVLTSFDRPEATEISYSELLCSRGVRPYKTGLIAVRKEIVAENRFAAPNVDFIFYRRLARRTKMFYLAVPLGIYHLADDDKDSLHLKRKKPTISLAVARAQALHEFVRDFADDFRRFCPEQLAPYAYGAAVGALLAGDSLRARLNIKLASQSQSQRVKYRLLYLFSYLPFNKQVLRLLFRWRASK